MKCHEQIYWVISLLGILRVEPVCSAFVLPKLLNTATIDCIFVCKYLLLNIIFSLNQHYPLLKIFISATVRLKFKCQAWQGIVPLIHFMGHCGGFSRFQVAKLIKSASVFHLGWQ